MTTNKNMSRSVTALTLIMTLLGMNLSNIAFAASAGALDNAFSGDGKVITNVAIADNLSDVAIQPDGKIVVAGRANNGGGFDFSVVRYNPDGSLDTTFDTDGKVTTDFGSVDEAGGVTIQLDGKIVVVGASDLGGAASRAFAIARFNVNGSLDTTFDSDGKVITDFGGGNDEALSVAIQLDGRIVAGGRAFGVDFGLARYNTNGSLDTTFDTDGKQSVDLSGGTDFGFEIALQTDGKIVIAGEADSDFGVARLNANGSLDTTFDSDGKVTTNLSGNDGAKSVAIQPDGVIVAAGNADGGQNCALARYFPDGSFGGSVITNFNTSSNESIEDVSIQANGKIVAAVSVGTAHGMNALRYNANGTIDTTFGTAGKVSIAVQPADNVKAMALSSDGKIVIVGDDGSDISLIRLNANVQPTASSDFDGDGVTDFAVFRPSNGTWFILNSSNNAFSFTPFGQNGDIPVDGDFDGDGRSDVAVFRPSVGTWFMLRSSDNQFLFTQFGQNLDRPIPGDFDKDGRTDISVFRPSTGQWFTLRSSDNTFVATQWGQNLDIPIPASAQ